MKKGLVLTSVLLGGALSFSLLTAPVSASADTSVAEYRKYCTSKIVEKNLGLFLGAQSYCPSRPMQYTHRVWVRCMSIQGGPIIKRWGEYAGGNSTSTVWCHLGQGVVDHGHKEFPEPP